MVGCLEPRFQAEGLFGREELVVATLSAIFHELTLCKLHAAPFPIVLLWAAFSQHLLISDMEIMEGFACVGAPGGFLSSCD